MAGVKVKRQLMVEEKVLQSMVSVSTGAEELKHPRLWVPGRCLEPGEEWSFRGERDAERRWEPSDIGSAGSRWRSHKVVWRSSVDLQV